MKEFLIFLFLLIPINRMFSQNSSSDTEWLKKYNSELYSRLEDMPDEGLPKLTTENYKSIKDKWKKENDINSIREFCHKELFFTYGMYDDEVWSISNNEAEEVLDILVFAADKGNADCQFMLGCVYSGDKTINCDEVNNKYKYLNDEKAIFYFKQFIKNPNKNIKSGPFGYDYNQCMEMIKKAYPKLGQDNLENQKLGYDLIIKKNGTEINAKVISVSKNEICYKKSSNMEGPSYILLTDEVFMIKYMNGEKDIFNSSINNKIKSDDVSTSLSVKGKQQTIANNIDLLRRDDLLKQSRVYKAWGKGLFWTILIGGTAGMICAGGTEWSTGTTLGYCCSLGVLSIVPMATLYSKGVRLKAQALNLNLVNIGSFNIGCSKIQSNLTMAKVPGVVSPAIGVGFKCNF